MSDKLKILIEMGDSGVTVSDNFTHMWKAEERMKSSGTLPHARFSLLLVIIDTLLRSMRGTRYTTMSTEEVKADREACDGWDKEWNRMCKKDWEERKARADSHANKG